MEAWDVIVAGLGIMGASVAREMARRGFRVVGIDALAPPHAMGSSHGRSRIIREAYFEDPLYVPMVQRAFGLWSALEAESGISLFRRTGALMVGHPTGGVVRGTLDSVRRHELAHEVLDATTMRERFPALSPADDMIGVLEERAGVLEAEHSHEAIFESARRSGAVFRHGERLIRFAAGGETVEVTTSMGTLRCKRLVICCGAWLSEVVAGSGFRPPPLAVERQVIAFFEPVDGAVPVDAGQCPVLLVEDPAGDLFYSIPDEGDGRKSAIHHGGVEAAPDSIDRVVHDDDIARIRNLLERYLPTANGAVREATVCLYTNSPDDHFIIDALPGSNGVFVASPCSGHGFKFALVIGEIVADMLGNRPAVFDPTPFRLSRFASR